MRLDFGRRARINTSALTLAVAPALKRALWRVACWKSSTAACADAAESGKAPLRCEMPQQCKGDFLMTLDAKRAQYLPPRLGVRTSPTRDPAVFNVDLQLRAGGTQVDDALSSKMRE